MKGDEEFEALKEQRDLRKARQPNENSACLVAVCDTEGMPVCDTDQQTARVHQYIMPAWDA